MLYFETFRKYIVNIYKYIFTGKFLNLYVYSSPFYLVTAQSL